MMARAANPALSAPGRGALVGVLLGVVGVLLAGAAAAKIGDRIQVAVHLVDAKGTGDRVGNIVITEVEEGVKFTLTLKNMPPGIHGFHLHTIGNCGPGTIDGKAVPAGAAGPIYDPFKKRRHDGPLGSGALGSLPFVVIDSDGTMRHSVTGTRLQIGDVQGRALLIKAGPDNYSDKPEPLGGSGPAIACGVVR